MKVGDVIRQGDVALRLVSFDVALLPEGAVVERDGRGQLVVKVGEGANHAHVMVAPNVTLIRGADVDYLVVKERKAALEHRLLTGGLTGEHKTVMVPPGVYELPVQMEYTRETLRPIRD